MSLISSFSRLSVGNRLAVNLLRNGCTTLNKSISLINERTICSSSILFKEVKFQLGRRGSLTTSDLKGKQIDESDDDILNIDALSYQITNDEDKSPDSFKTFPDMETLKTKFDGTLFTDLPTILIVCAPNNTKFYGFDKNNEMFLKRNPTFIGFKNASCRSNVAGQLTGVNMGQALRNQSVTSVKVAISGFNNARISSIKGLVQAGIKIVAIQDITPVYDDWRFKPKKRKRGKESYVFKFRY